MRLRVNKLKCFEKFIMQCQNNTNNVQKIKALFVLYNAKVRNILTLEVLNLKQSAQSSKVRQHVRARSRRSGLI